MEDLLFLGWHQSSALVQPPKLRYMPRKSHET
jgi:hypothetical protein